MTKQPPLVSYLLFAYNQERFIRDAVKSAFSQTYEPLEIILSDDCSSDQTFEIIKEEAGRYKGPHSIITNRNNINLGLANHINRVFKMSKGLFFIMAAGDDISVSERTELLVNRWLNKNNPVHLVCSYFQDININGEPTGFIEKNTVFTPDISQPVQRWVCGATGACAGYSRAIYDKYGPLDSRIIAEDWVFSFRAWLESGIGLIELPLVKHRTHEKSLFVIYNDIRKAEKNLHARRNRRMRGLDNQLARAEEWEKAWCSSGKIINRDIRSEIQQWKMKLLLERKAYEADPLLALKYALSALNFPNGKLLAMKIVIRHVFHLDY